MTVLEAKRCGVPIITFSWGDSTNEVVDNDGFIVESDDEFIEKITLLIFHQIILRINTLIILKITRNYYDIKNI